jgi:hypothetical protein
MKRGTDLYRPAGEWDGSAMFEGVEDGALAGGGLTALGHAAVAGSQDDQRHAVQFVAQGAPGVAKPHTGRGYALAGR